MNMRATVGVLLTIASAMLVPIAAHAQEARGGGGAVSARMVAELQQLGAERTALKTENEHLKKQLAAVTAERDQLQKGERATDLLARSSAAELARSNAQQTSTQQKLTALQGQTQQLIAKFREIVDTLRKTEIEEAQTKQTLAMRQQDLRTCTDRNHALYKIDNDVLTHFERQGFLARLASDEPFTRIERVRLENYGDESRARADEQRYAPPAGAIPPN